MAEAQVDEHRSVGAAMARARMAAGLSLDDVASHLRIRRDFLQALENGDEGVLPGMTYAIGYVRTYAGFLGMDADETVRRFKEESEGLDRRTELVFPSPAPEGKVPGMSVILASAVLAGVAYGGWYWMSERGFSIHDIVPAVPERLAVLIDGGDPGLAGAATTTDPVTSDAATSGSPGLGVPAADYAQANPTSVPVTAQTESGTESGIDDASTGGQIGSVEPEPAATEPTATEPAPAQPVISSPAPATIPSGPVAADLAAAEPTSAEPTSAEPVSAPGNVPPTAPTVSANTSDPGSTPTVTDPLQVAAVPTTPSSEPEGDGDAAEPAATQPVISPASSPAGRPAVPEGPADVGAVDSRRGVARLDDAPSPTETAAVTPVAATAGPPSGDQAVVPRAPRLNSLIGASEAAVPAAPSTSDVGTISERIVLRATGDSWVQIRTDDGTTLFTRVLREGDVYRVPDRPGLTLATGNAGALEVLVDGRPAPTLGSFGEVVRNIQLDPESLSGGTVAGTSN